MLKRPVLAMAAVFAWVTLLPAAGTAAGDVATGRALFVEANCWLCHGEGGEGNGPVAPASPVEPRNFTAGRFKFDADDDGKPGGDEDLVEVIQQGALAFGGSAIMMPNPALTEDEIRTIVAFVRSLRH